MDKRRATDGIVALNLRQNWQHLRDEAELQDPVVVKKVLANGIADAYMAEKNAQEQGLEKTRRTGNIIHSRIGPKTMTVFIHAPWPAPEKDTRLAYPVGGVIDKAMRRLPEKLRPAGFDVDASPFADARITEAVYAQGYEDLRFTEAIRNFPGPKDPGIDVRTFYKIVENDAENVERVVRQFR